MKSAKKNLLPCPFCGSKANWHENAGWWVVECSGCRVSTLLHESRQVAARVWNRRVMVRPRKPSPQAKPEAVSGPDYRAAKENAPRTADGGKVEGLAAR